MNMGLVILVGDAPRHSKRALESVKDELFLRVCHMPNQLGADVKSM